MSDRQRTIERLRRYVLRRGLPRFEMSVIVMGTGIAGFAASVTLLALGVSSMGLRYPLAVVVAYIVFLGLIRLWVQYHRRHLHADLDAIDAVSGLIPDHSGLTSIEPLSGGGSGFGGGGASDSWVEAPSPATAHSGALASPVEEFRTPSSGEGSTGIFDFDLDEGWVILVPIGLLAGGMVAAFFVVYSAPVLLAEVALDVLLVSGLYRRLKKLEPHSWLITAVRRTWIPVTAVAVLVAAGGFVMQAAVPQADSIGDVLRRVQR